MPILVSIIINYINALNTNVTEKYYDNWNDENIKKLKEEILILAKDCEEKMSKKSINNQGPLLGLVATSTATVIYNEKLSSKDFSVFQNDFLLSGINDGDGEH